MNSPGGAGSIVVGNLKWHVFHARDATATG